MRFYETEHFKQLIKQFQLRENVDTSNMRIERCRTRIEVANLFDRHSGYYKDRLPEATRLIGDIVEVENDLVFVWYNAFRRKDSKYHNLGTMPKDQVEKGFSMADLQSWYKEKVKTEGNRDRPPKLPDSLLGWLYAPNGMLETSGTTSDWYIFESHDWVNTILDIGRNDLGSFRRTVEKLVTSLENSQEQPNPNAVEIASQEDGSAAVTYQRVEAGKLLLLKPYAHEKEFERENSDEVLNVDWRRQARRAYPAYIVTDLNLWKAVQDENQANLALSPEEEKLLEVVAGKSTGKHALPLFINGQAGSGKSTMLSYIFAGFCRQKQLNNLEGVPIYLTYNTALVKAASKASSKILDSNIEMRGKLGFDIDELFISWRDFLRSLLPDEPKKQFDEKNRIDFHQFKLATAGVGGRLKPHQGFPKDLSAELAWYVIRSLIKGSSHLADLDPDSYPDIHEKDKVITEEAFSEVYKEVYEKWYKPNLSNSDLWDDQDLVSAALTEGSFEGRAEPITAVVIDEAQDFTRRELRFVAGMMAFSKYELPNGQNVSLPIVFAGDPMQTLSPTGFRWDAVKALIYEELESIAGKSMSQPSFEMLSNNYRSTSKIVEVANAVQLWRVRLFGEAFKLQKAWNPLKDSTVPQKFIIGGEFLSEQQFQEFAAQTIIIIPCDEGGEIDFIKRDGVLSKMYPNISSQDPAGNVHSSLSAKGLEFERVILYKFGEGTTIDWSAEFEKDSERDLTGEYFLNKLYVAVSRATKFLVVVDTESGDETLWSHLSQDSMDKLLDQMYLTQHKTLQRLNLLPSEIDLRQRELPFAKALTNLVHLHGGNDLATVKGIEDGFLQVELLKNAFTDENPKINADKIREHGIRSRNPKMLRQAKSFYRQLGYLSEAHLCEAHALRYEAKNLEAGREFKEANDHEHAFKAFWEAGSWSDVNDMVPLNTLVLKPLEVTAVVFMVTEPRDQRALSDFVDEIKSAIDRKDMYRRSEVQWEEIVNTLKDCFSNRDNVDLSGELLDNGAAVLESLQDFGYPGCAGVAAEIYMKRGATKFAESLWERYSIKVPEKHAMALSKQYGLPTGLKYLAQAEMHTAIVSEWKDAGQPKDDTWLAWVVPSLMKAEKFEELYDLYVDIEKFEKAEQVLLSELPKSGKFAQLARNLCVAYGNSGKVKAADLFIEKIEKIQKSNEKRLTTEFLRALAESKGPIGPKSISEEDRLELAKIVKEVNDHRSSQWQKVDREKIGALHLGAVAELAEMPDEAFKIYEREVSNTDKSIMQLSRMRWVTIARMLGRKDEANARKDAWKIRNGELTDWPIFKLASSERSTLEIPGKTNGGLGAFAWDLVLKTPTEVRLTVDDPEHPMIAFVDLKAMVVRPVERLVKSDMNNLYLSMGGWNIAIAKTDRYIITMEGPKGEILSDTILASDLKLFSSAPKTNGPGRVSTVKGNVKGYELKKELGLSTPQFNKAITAAGFGRRNLNSRFTPEEANRVREARGVEAD